MWFINEAKRRFLIYFSSHLEQDEESSIPFECRLHLHDLSLSLRVEEKEKDRKEKRSGPRRSLG